MKDAPCDSEPDSDGSPDDHNGHSAESVHSLVHKVPQLQSSLAPPSALRSLSPSEVPQSSSAPFSSMSVQRASPAYSHSQSPPTHSSALPVDEQPVLHRESYFSSILHPSDARDPDDNLAESSEVPDQVDAATQKAAMLVLTQAMLPQESSPTLHPLPPRPATLFIGDKMYVLPDPQNFFLHKINVKCFSDHFLKINRAIDMQKMTAEVLLECYRTFINRFFPMARSGLKANVLSCVNRYRTLYPLQ